MDYAIHWKPYPGKQEDALAYEKVDEKLYGGGRGAGKRLADTTPIFTGRGWVPAGAVCSGDTLLAPDGTLCPVIGIYRTPNGDMYRVVFDDGAEVLADADHLWSVRSDKHGKRDGFVVRSTREILGSKGRWSVPLMSAPAPGKAWEGPDPYVIGQILGNGTLTGAHTTVYTAEIETAELLRADGFRIYKYREPVFMCQLMDERYRDVLGRCKGDGKAVPTALLESDPASRLALLQGLMDSDGSVDKEGRVTFCSVSSGLASAVQYLARSLGGKASVRKVVRVSGKGGRGWYYLARVTHAGKFRPFRLARKADRVNPTQNGAYRRIVSIEKAPDCPATCFKIGHSSSLFVIDGFVVTHNTDVGQAWMVHPDYISNPRYRGLVIRQQAVDLSDWIDRAKTRYAPLGAVFSGNPVRIAFPSGAAIVTGHLNDESAYQKYQGHEYQRLLIEEASHIPSEDRYERLIQSCRSTIDGLPARILLTSNPDGDGAQWLKDRFRIKPGGAIQWFETDVGKVRMYVPSTVFDNPSLLKDKAYVNSLRSISDPDLQAAWLEGSWESFKVKGSYYGELLAKMREEGRICRVPHEPTVKVHTYWDLGMDDSTSIIFAQTVKSEVRIFDYLEGSGEGLAWYAKEILNRPYAYAAHHLPHDVKVRELGTGKSRYEVLQGLLPHGIDVAPNLPLSDGIQAVRLMFGRLWIDERKGEQLVKHLERYRKKWNPELQVFMKEPVHDSSSHGADALRYLAVSPDTSSGGAMGQWRTHYDLNSAI